MRIEYSYNIEKEKVYNRIDNLLSSLQEKYKEDMSNPQKRWNSNKDKMEFNMLIKGYEISGIITLQDNKVIIEGKLPFIAKMFSGKIENAVKSQLETLLA